MRVDYKEKFLAAVEALLFLQAHGDTPPNLRKFITRYLKTLEDLLSNWCNFTASKSERAWHCPASFALPEVPRKAGYPAQRGTFGHSYLEAGLRGSQEDADMFLFTKEDKVPAWWIKDMEKIKIADVEEKLAALHPSDTYDIFIEAAYAYDSQYGMSRLLGQSIGRNYPKGADFTGSSDYTMMDSDTTVVVDFKFGSQPVHEDCLQLRNLAVLAVQVGSSTNAIVAVAQFNKADGMSLPEELPSKKYSSHELELARNDLDATIKNINEARRLVMLGDTPKVNPGDWCKWCDCTTCEFYEGKLCLVLL